MIGINGLPVYTLKTLTLPTKLEGFGSGLGGIWIEKKHHFTLCKLVGRGTFLVAFIDYFAGSNPPAVGNSYHPRILTCLGLNLYVRLES